MENNSVQTKISGLSPLSFVKDIDAGKGEDASPTWHMTSSDFSCAVFDGLGGAGSNQYTDQQTGKIHSGAFIASKNAAIVVDAYFKKNPNWFLSSDTAAALHAAICDSFATLDQQYKSLPSAVKVTSSMHKKFPSTIALIAGYASAQKDKYEITSIWAGDSRSYIFDNTGLQALSVDDVTPDTYSQGMDRFVHDGVMNNCIRSDKPFKLNEIKTSISIPSIAIVASDGVFGAYKTPVHFEQMLLSTLNLSGSMTEWSLNIQKKLSEVAQDDVSMVAVPIGFNDFWALKSHYAKRHMEIENYLKVLLDCERECDLKSQHVEDLKRKLKSAIDAKEKVFDDIWVKYKDVFERNLKGR